MKFGKYRSWKRANDRRCELNKKSRDEITVDEENERLELQQIAGKIREYLTAPLKKKLVQSMAAAGIRYAEETRLSSI